jgi:hypothetical protein
MNRSKFGDCCKDLKHAMTVPQGESLFHVAKDGILFMAVGFVQTDSGVGWYESAVIFCPFCGTKIQDKENLKQSAGPAGDETRTRH